jgi:hypothetical protein
MQLDTAWWFGANWQLALTACHGFVHARQMATDRVAATLQHCLSVAVGLLSSSDAGKALAVCAFCGFRSNLFVGPALPFNWRFANLKIILTCKSDLTTRDALTH